MGASQASTSDCCKGLGDDPIPILDADTSRVRPVDGRYKGMAHRPAPSF
jgi:hypothetical protein